MGHTPQKLTIELPRARESDQQRPPPLSGGAPQMSSESDSPDLQKAKTFFQYGNDATIKSNYDYAINMYREACKYDPENMMYRQALRGVEKRKFNNDPTKVGMLVGAKNQPIRLRAKASKAKGNHQHVLVICEEAFVNNPWDVGASREAAEAAEQLGYHALAEWYVECVQEVTKDLDFLKFSARVHESNESWHKAIACWERVKKLSPNDQDANRQINALSASSTIKRAGLDEALEKRASAAAPEPAESLEAKLERLKQEQLSPEQRLIKEILADPTATHAYVDLADIYKQRNDLEKAEKVLAKGLKANPDDQALKAVHEDTQISRLKQAIEKQTQKVRERPDDTEPKVRLDQLTQMLDKYEVEAFRRRVNLRPEDGGLHYQLGLVLQRIGSYDEAIAEYQQARSSAAHKIPASCQLGLCFEAISAWKLADRTYREALKGLEEEDQQSFLRLHYRLGRVAEAMGNTESAQEHYNEVAAIDYTYEDVAERLRRLI
jgi:tetratricopeptide (TPR) repeat protein